MYFPENMNFQYFFFDTYIGYFLQALPIALVISAIYGIIKFRKDKEATAVKKLFSCIFVCYITGLFCLVIGLDLIHIFWYELLYHMKSGIEIRFFSGNFDLVLDFFNHINGESIGNFLMFLPFGILHPLSQKNPKWGKTIKIGILTVLIIEVLQPVLGRAFDINDIILNTLGIFVSASFFTVIKKLIKKLSNITYML